MLTGFPMTFARLSPENRLAPRRSLGHLDDAAIAAAYAEQIRR